MRPLKIEPKPVASSPQQANDKPGGVINLDVNKNVDRRSLESQGGASQEEVLNDASSVQSSKSYQ